MKIKDLIVQLSTYDAEAEIELMYLSHSSTEDIPIRLTAKEFYIIPCIHDMEKMTVSSVLLATVNSLEMYQSSNENLDKEERNLNE